VRTLFWWDPWLEGGILKDRFSRLFYLFDNKLATDADMFSLACGEGGETWKWRRSLLAWDEELGMEDRAPLLPIVLQTDMNEKWIWQQCY